MPTAVHRSWCALFVLGLFIPVAFAEDFGLANPAAKEFSDFKPERRSTENVARRSPAFQDQILPIPQTQPPEQSEPIQQVSANNELNDPFPTVSQPSMPQSTPFDWGVPSPTAPITPNNPLLPQNIVLPYDPQGAAGYGNPYPAMQGMQNMYPAGAGMGYAPQFAQQQFAQPPYAQYQQQYAMPGMTPYMNPYAYAQGGLVEPDSQFAPSFADPYGMYQLNYQPDYYQETPQEMAQYQSLYQALLLQARLQAEEDPDRISKGKRQDAEETKKQADASWTFNNLMPVKVTSPLGDTLYACAKTVSPFYSPAGPDKGVGMPLVGKSWLDHPWYVGGFVGQISGSDLVSKMIKQKSGGTGGLICGYNFNDYWGLESRLHFAAIDIYDTAYARELFDEVAQGDVVLLPSTRTNKLTVLDASVHYYPLGNAKWRPYFKYGLGFGQQKFVNTFGNRLSADVVTMPLGMGVRYWWNERIALQADLVDNVVFASGIAKTQNNVAVTLGLTYAFGNGKKQHPFLYWPFTPSMGSKW